MCAGRQASVRDASHVSDRPPAGLFSPRRREVSLLLSLFRESHDFKSEVGFRTLGHTWSVVCHRVAVSGMFRRFWTRHVENRKILATEAQDAHSTIDSAEVVVQSESGRQVQTFAP